MKKKAPSKEDTLKSFVEALDEIERLKGIKKSDVLAAVETALVAAYKKDYKAAQNVRVKIDPVTGVIDMFSQKVVCETTEDEITQISLEEAKQYGDNVQLGDVLEFRLEPADFGRVAAQNAKQYILQQIKEG
ncbi:MAG: transcription termination/antitermination protein NusA, partial [Eubacteriaceae bacterium]|nr:transcription termination/antitermination protein NusA [Eubacteriaceae bacterium]